MNRQIMSVVRSLRRTVASVALIGAGFVGGCQAGDQLVLVNDAGVVVEVSPSRVSAGVGGTGQGTSANGGGAQQVSGPGSGSGIQTVTVAPGSATTLDRGPTGGSASGGRVTRFGVRALPAGAVQWFEVPSLGSFLVRFSPGQADGPAILIAIDERSGPAQRDAQDRQVREIIDRPRYEGGPSR